MVARSPLVFDTFLKCGKLQCKSTFNRKQVCLLIIEHIELTKQFYICEGICDSLRNHLSCVTCHVSCVTCHFLTSPKLQISHNIPYTLCVQCHTSGVTYQVSHVRYHMSLIMCHVPCVMCYLSYAIYIFFYKVAELVG